ncbi:Type 1 glutamine amidotransferase-like domain-containing protein [Deinococcus sp.]|uniref:Type 1 glutamine amidotransferase-like domain-containing protein n=1 Tax=Deinococcus sp. TaxID=47478 RepID=UPI0025F8FE7E|nr:Type 1 glutamine amidotransferase-like domain-containing protein [Deinococcus sp.]
MTSRSLFLLGGTEALAAMTPDWLARTRLDATDKDVIGTDAIGADATNTGASGGAPARLVILACGAGWQGHMSTYTRHWGAQNVQFIGPDDNGALDLNRATALISGASGLCVAGGDTALYHSLYGVGLLRELLRACYAAGIPYAGLSAGALLAMDTCVLYPPDTADIALLPGLGLLPDTLVGVHFSSAGGASAFEPVMEEVPASAVWGIDDDACAVFEDERFVGKLGGAVYRLGSRG